MSVKPIVLGILIKDYATKTFIKELVGLVPSKSIDYKLKSQAMILAKMYAVRKRKYHRNNNIQLITSESKEFNHFIKALHLISRYKVSPKVFLEAQIKGLSFINKGNGVFPTPAQLSTSSAEERLIQVMHEDGTDSNDLKREELNYLDRTTPLMENPKFVSIYEKIEDKTATHKEAAFVQDCMIARKGKATKLVRDYIEGFESE